MKDFKFILSLILLLTACQPTAEKPQQTTQKVDKKEQLAQVSPHQPTTKTESEENEYRNKNWRPSEGAYYFSEAYTWTYQNELLAIDDPFRAGTFIVYCDPPTGTMLLTKSQAKFTDEMTEWIIIHPDENYTTAFIDVHGKPHIQKQKMVDFPDHAFRLTQQEADFDKYFKKVGNTRKFGSNMYGWQTVQGIPFQMTFEQTKDTAELYLLEMPFSMRGLYLVKQTNPDLNFPVNLDFGYLLPENQLVLSDEIDFGGKKVFYELTSITPGEYFVNTTTFLQDH